jgi:tripartite-type tricarboxylate transporter receptor subunit TctC
MGETGFPQIGSTSWYGALAPAKTPPALIKKLHDEFVSALQTADLRESLVAGGAEIVGNSPAQFAVFLKQEIETARMLLKVSGAKRDY